MPRLALALFFAAVLPSKALAQAVQVAVRSAPGAPVVFAPPVLRALSAQIQALQPSVGDAGAMAMLLVARAGASSRASAPAGELASAVILKRALTQPASYAAVQRSLAADPDPLARSVAEGVRSLRASILPDRRARETFERAFSSLEGSLKTGSFAEVGGALDRFFEGSNGAGAAAETPLVRGDRPLGDQARPAASLEAFSSPAGRAEAAEALSRPGFEPAGLLEALELDPFLRGEYAKPAGVSEGYSLERHTLMVMSQFERYFPGELPGGTDKRLFRLLLALHDIGKPWAVVQGQKSRQHERTVVLLERYLPRYGFSGSGVRLAVALSDGDPIGGYLQRKDLGAAVAKLREMSGASGLERERFFDLLLVYYMADASSYTADAGGKASLDHLFVFDRMGRKLSFSPEVARRIDVLREAFLKG